MLNEQLLDVDDDDGDGEASIEPNTYELVEESINKLGIEYTEESSGERSRRRYVHERIDRVVMVLHGIIVVISGIYVVLMMTLFYCLKRHLHQMLISNACFFPSQSSARQQQCGCPPPGLWNYYLQSHFCRDRLFYINVINSCDLDVSAVMQIFSCHIQIFRTRLIVFANNPNLFRTAKQEATGMLWNESRKLKQMNDRMQSDVSMMDSRIQR